MGDHRLNPKTGTFTDAIQPVFVTLNTVATTKRGTAVKVKPRGWWFVACGTGFEPCPTFIHFHFLVLLHIIIFGDQAGDVFAKFGNKKSIHVFRAVWVRVRWW